MILDEVSNLFLPSNSKIPSIHFEELSSEGESENHFCHRLLMALKYCHSLQLKRGNYGSNNRQQHQHGTTVKILELVAANVAALQQCQRR